MDQSHIRNFCIIAHIDHGKSTLADRLLEATGTVEKRNTGGMHRDAPLLDTMDLERERGITIKLQPARMSYRSRDGQNYQLNLIDTPGHVDFTYEVSRSLASVEGALILVDATQGVQAQTIANLYLALEQNLTLIPILNKIDLPNAEIERRAEELIRLMGCTRDEILLASGKTGQGVENILERIVKDVPPPSGDRVKAFRAGIFDSKYDEYKGVIAYVRVVDGVLSQNEKITFLATQSNGVALDVGYLTPEPVSTATIEAGEVGYVVTSLKDIGAVRVGDTITQLKIVPTAGRNPVTASSGIQPARSISGGGTAGGKNETSRVDALPGYKDVRPMVYAGIYPKEGSEYAHLRDAVMKLKLSDAALAFEPEHSAALGFGFRCGLLGMLHLEIVQERLRREHGMEIVVTTPSVAYEVTLTDGEKNLVMSPQAFPDASHLAEAREPWVSVDIVCPAEYIGNVMALVTERRGIYKTIEYYDVTRAVLRYEMPLSSVIVDFYDTLKGVTAGYASLHYEQIGFRAAPIVLLEILVAEKPVAAFATLIHRDEAYRRGKEIVEALRETLPRQQFVVKLQAVIGSKVIASERISAFRKDVTGYLYGGDVTRKMKLLEKQKKGKKRMMSMGVGGVDIPQEAFLRVLKRG